MRTIQSLLALLFAIAVTGCAHPIVISPDISKITVEADGNARPIERNVGYYISLAKRDSPVETPGGGGDKVKYYPYREIETGFYSVLSNVFSDVTLLKSETDVEGIAQTDLAFIIIPEIVTDSSSPSMLTWPPKRFSVKLTCNIKDKNGNVVATPSVTGEGQAEFDEFKHDFSLSAKRAALDALLKLQDALLKTAELHAP